MKKNVTVEEVAHLIGKSPQFIRIGLQKGIFPWGYAVNITGRRWTYWINAEKFKQVEGVSL